MIIFKVQKQVKLIQPVRKIGLGVVTGKALAGVGDTSGMLVVFYFLI